MKTIYSEIFLLYVDKQKNIGIIYGKKFDSVLGKTYENVFNECKKTKNVNYFGFLENKKTTRDKIPDEFQNITNYRCVFPINIRKNLIEFFENSLKSKSISLIPLLHFHLILFILMLIG